MTGFAHPKCYMASTHNCSTSKSREHYISEAILERFDRLLVTGMPWQEPGSSQVFPTNALAATILCERHNNALAPVDQFGLRAFDAIIQACDYALGSSHSGRVQHHLVSGEGVELWLYKLLAGIHFGGIAAAECGLLRDTCGFPTDTLVSALTTGTVPRDANLWISSGTGSVQRGSIAVGPLIDVAQNCNVGVLLRFGPINFEAMMVPAPLTVAQHANNEWRRRPRIIDFVGPARDSRLVLTWPGLANEVKRLEIKVDCMDAE